MSQLIFMLMCLAVHEKCWQILLRRSWLNKNTSYSNIKNRSAKHRAILKYFLVVQKLSKWTSETKEITQYRQKIDVSLSLWVRRIGTCNLFYCLRKCLFYGTFNVLTSLFFIFCFLRFCNFKDQIKTSERPNHFGVLLLLYVKWEPWWELLRAFTAYQRR